MRAADCFARDDRKRREAGWTGMAFIAPEFPKPRTVAERVARLLIPEQSYTLHVYTVLELLEKAYALGRTQRSTS